MVIRETTDRVAAKSIERDVIGHPFPLLKTSAGLVHLRSRHGANRSFCFACSANQAKPPTFRFSTRKWGDTQLRSFRFAPVSDIRARSAAPRKRTLREQGGGPLWQKERMYGSNASSSILQP
jgi:hypothetical protein